MSIKKFVAPLLIACSAISISAKAEHTQFERFENWHKSAKKHRNKKKNFNRISSFAVCSQIDASCNTDEETAAEIVAASTDGMTLIYSNSPRETVEFVDISNPHMPVAAGEIALSGEPTSVAVVGPYALVGVNTSADFVNASGELQVIDIASKTIVHSINLGGQPDSVAVSPNGKYAAVVIENERDEDLGDGAPPQAPAGYLVSIKLQGMPSNWTPTQIDLSGIADLYPGDPEPEYVDINKKNIAVVSLQENNHLILVDLKTNSVINDFSAGSVDLQNIDATEEDPALISLTESQDGVLREPDGVSWLNNHYFATADEGDLDGGSRGFTIYNKFGRIVYNSGNSMDHWAVRLGHYPDARSGNKGNEPENVEVGTYGKNRFLFVASERSSLVFVYEANNPRKLKLKQILPAGVGPEGVLAIPSRNLLIAASEKDDRGDKMRSVLNIYQYQKAKKQYPTLVSKNRMDGTPIPWSALSGLVADPYWPHILHTVEDSFYQQNRILSINTWKSPAVVKRERRIMDSNDVLASLPATSLADPSVAANDPSRISTFDEADLAAIINDDKSINIDPEGIAVASDGGFWVASEGSGTMGDAGRPINTLNMIIKTDRQGVIEQVVTLPDAINQIQLRFGFEGVAVSGDNVYVAFQRAWNGEANPRIGIYNTSTNTWSFVFYPLDAVESQDGGWVGLSDITHIEDEKFLVLERDNKGGPDAAVKRIYKIDLAGAAADSTITKTLVRDIVPDLDSVNGSTFEKVEGLALKRNGDVYIVNDNDGVDDNSGETQLMNLGKILMP